MTTLLLNRFFATLKKEELYRKDYTSETDFKRCLASYIEFYNTQRPHRTLKNRTPCQVEELFMNGKWGEQLTDITGVRISSITRFVFWFYPVCIFQVTQDMKYRKAWTPCNARSSGIKWPHPFWTMTSICSNWVGSFILAGGNNSEPCIRRSCAVADLKIKQQNFEKSYMTRRIRCYFRRTEFRLLNTTIADLPNRYSVKVFVPFELYVSFGLSVSVLD